MASTTAVTHTAAYRDADKGPTINGVILTVAILSTIFVLARLFTRKKILGALHLDDYLVTAAIILEWVQVALAVVAVKDGNGRHFDLLDTEQQENAIFYTILGFPFGVMAFGIPKLAVAALLVRLMNPGRIHRIFLWALPAATMISLIICIVILYAQCTPARAQWTFSITDKTCWSPYVLVDFAIFAGSLSAFTDLYLAIYPGTVLWTLQLNIRKKIALSVALGIGSVATVIAIYKCTRLPSLASSDFSYDTSDLVIWTIIEASAIIIACCIPVLQPLVDLLFGRRTFGTSSGYKNYSSNNGQQRSDVELTHSRQNRSNNRGDTMTAKYLGSSGGVIEVDSQESILQHGSAKMPTEISSVHTR